MLPIDFTERMKKLLGDEFDEFLATFQDEKYQALRFNLNKYNNCDDLSFSKFSDLLNFSLTQVPWEPSGFYYPKDARPGKHPYHEAGVYYIQEPSAMAPAALLDVTPGDFVLDLCAAPGGKSSQIASYLKQSGLLISNEIHPARAKILSENMERMGLQNCIVTNEAPAKLSTFFPAYFDKIMVDAPCSGEGMFRKNEEASEEWSLDNVALCADRQDEVLEEAAKMLRPGGRMVYSTCTFAPAENEGSVARFLASHKEFHLIPAEKEYPFSKGHPDWLTSYEASNLEQTVIDNICFSYRLWPHKLHGEGHFVAIFEKDGLKDRSGIPSTPKGFWKSISEKEYTSFLEFVKEEQLTLSVKGKAFTKFGDQLYLLPENAPQLDKCKILRPGLHLGTLCKNRFEPSHALALTLKPGECKHICALTLEDSRIYSYLNGETFPWDGEKGWYLITVDGFSIGFGKCAGGIMKNHYPKGLRKTGWTK